MSRKHCAKPKVHLIAYDRFGKPVLEQVLPVRRYREHPHPLLDDPAFRKAHAIVRLSGVICDTRGNCIEEFEAQFDASGICICDAARLGDGTILGNWKEMRVSLSV